MGGKGTGRIYGIINRSFFIVMAVHLAVFVSIGLFTDRGWGLLWLFLALLVPVLVAKWALERFFRGRRESGSN